MKIVTLLTVLFYTSLSFAQIDFGKQVKKKDVNKGLVTFETGTDEHGAIFYRFSMHGNIVGGSLLINAKGIATYANYNTKHEMDGTTIEINEAAGEIAMYTYRKNMMDGPAFQLINGKVGWFKQFKNNKEDSEGYTVTYTNSAYTSYEKGTTMDGFQTEKYKNSYAVGYFAYGRKAFPMIQVWNEGGSYYGQYIQGERKEFGVYFFKDGSRYIGAWHKNNMEGLGFKLSKNGEVIEKGYYNNNELVIKL
jgi:hypothetical protein